MTRRHEDNLAARGTPPVAALPDRACAGLDAEVFFPEKGRSLKPALDICGLCPHREPCLEWALETRQAFGVWGGTTGDQRELILKNRKAAA